jgi:hypothetical protein
MKHIPLATHLLARRFWRPLAQAASSIQRPLLHSYDWLFTKRKLENACLRLLRPLVRSTTWLARKASQARAPRLFRHSSFAYDVAAVCVTLLAPLARWHDTARKRMRKETDARLREEDPPNIRNGECKHPGNEQS